MRLLSPIPGMAKQCAFVIVIMLVAIPGALAQSDIFPFDRNGEQENTVPDRDPSSEELDEMQSVYNRCTKRFHSQYLDCRCIAVKFLDQRMTEGPKPPKRLLLDRVYKQCPATANIAGKTYRRCLGWASMRRSDYKRFCECYANEYASIFSKNPSLRSHAQQNMMSKAMDECDYNQALNRRIRERNAVGSRNRSQSEIDTIFGDDGE